MITESIKYINNNMKKFAEFCNILSEAKFRTIPESIITQSRDIATTYAEAIEKLTPSVFKKLKTIGISSDWVSYFNDTGDTVWFMINLNTVKFKDLKTNKTVKFTVYAAFGKNNQNYAICDTDNKIIILYDDNCRNLRNEKLVSTIIHEITHGFQQHKEYSKKYKKLVTQKSPEAKLTASSLYHKEPIEFDAFTTEMSHAIKTEYSKIKNNIQNAKMPETKKIMERKLEKFLLELKLFIQSPLNTYFAYKELPLPTSLETFEDMLVNIQNTPKLWKSFKIKMINLYTYLNNKK